MRSRTIIHDTSSFISNTNVPSLFFQLADRSLLNCLPGINQPCRELYDNLVDWRPVLLLQKDLRAILLIQKSDDVDSIDRGVCRSCLRFH